MRATASAAVVRPEPASRDSRWRTALAYPRTEEVLERKRSPSRVPDAAAPLGGPDDASPARPWPRRAPSGRRSRRVT